MNPKPISETEAIRSDIEMTRRRMDDTVEALGERLRGRHLVDEVIGFFRGGEDGSGTGARVREKITETAGTAAHAVADTIKKNPVPILLITAGVAWLAYSASRRGRSEVDDAMYQPDPYDPDIHYDRPIEYPGATSAVGEPVEGSSEEERSRFAEMKESIAEKAASAKDQIAGKMSDLSHQARDKMQALQGRASEFGSRVQDRTRAAYIKTRDQVVQTADQHPLEVGLGCLAIGFVAGLAIPTPAPVNRYVGPTVDRLRARTREAGREMLQKGKRVAEAASNAARDEAQSQGITVDRLRSSASAIKDRAQSAATEAARDESAGGATPPM